MLKNSSFFVFQGNSVFSMIEQAELNQAFFQDLASRAEPSFLEGMASQAEPSFFSQKLEPKPSRDELRLGPNTTTFTREFCYQNFEARQFSDCNLVSLMKGL